MPLKPRYHYAWFEAQTPDADGIVKIPGSNTHAKKTGRRWEIGQATEWTWDKTQNKHIQVPRHFVAKGPVFHPDKVVCTGYIWMLGQLFNIKKFSRASKPVKSPVYQWGPIEVQGEGNLIIEHAPDGTMTSVHTEKPALQKTWHKDKYAEEKEKRRKAEKTLKVMLKMGVLGQGDVQRNWNYVRQEEYEKVNYAEILDSLADCDGETNDKDLEKIGDLIRRIRAREGCTPEDAFEHVRRRMRDLVYSQKNVYTWEPVQDGRDRVDL